MNHVPVLLSQSIDGLALQPGATCIDCTVGGASHSETMLLATAPNGRLLGLDADPEAIERSRMRLARFGDRVTLANVNFHSLTRVATALGFATAQAILLDLGVSSFHLADANRGFSFQYGGPLDMRLSPEITMTAAEIVNEWSVEELAEVIFRYGEEQRSRRIARAIAAARPVHTTTELAAIVSRAIGGSHERIHPATRVFQALRIKVNDELGVLESTLPQVAALLTTGGRFAVISFHSLEDRIVKQFIQRESHDCLCPPDLPKCVCGHKAILRPVTRKPILPDETETRDNPRSRSAKLRIAEKL